MSKQDLVRNLITWVSSQPKPPKLSNAFIGRFTDQVLENVASLTVAKGRFSAPELGTFRVFPYQERTFKSGFGKEGAAPVTRPAGQRIRFRASRTVADAAQTASLYSRQRVNDSSSSSSSSSDSDAQ